MSSASDATKGNGKAAGNGNSGRRRRRVFSDDDDDERYTLHHRHRRKPSLLQIKSTTMTSSVTLESQLLASPPILQQPRSQEQSQLQLQSQQPQLQHQGHIQIQNQQHQPLSPLIKNMNSSEPTNMDADKKKKLLEWELSTLEANDLRSHAWYHGEFVGRVEVERLLRKYVTEEHGIRIATISKMTNINSNQVIENTDNITNAAIPSFTEDLKDSVAPRAGGEETGCDSDSDSDGLEDVSSMSSDGDFAMDDYLDELKDDDGRVPDPSMATSSFMTTALLINQKGRLDGVLPVKRPKHQPKHRKHFYCFLVRASVNVKPPGRYVLSCLRVDKYDDAEDMRKNGEDERSQKKRLRRQLKRRQLRQQRHPVLHFVINEIILQPGTVYERSQFTFGDSLPSVASMATMCSNNIGAYNQPIQPGFDSVPDLIRYYVGSASDDAVLSYGGGNEGVLGSNTIFPQTVPTEVRIRYPCNRRNPLTSEVQLQHSHALATAAALSKQLPVPNACTIVPVVPKCSPQHPTNWTHGPSTFRPSHRRTPSATVTSATITSVPSSAAGSATPDKQLEKSLIGPSKIISNSFNTEFTSSLNRSSTTLPRPSTSSSPRPPLIPESYSSSLNHSSTTLSRPSESIFLRSSSTSGSSSNPDLLKMALSPSTSSSPVTKLKMAPNASISDSSSLSSSFSSLSRFSPSTNVSSNKLYSQVELASWEPSTSAGFSTLVTSRSSELRKALTSSGLRRTGIIDMDAEIAAALDAENRISDDEFDFYHIPDPPIVRSSFARVDVANSHLNRSGSHHSRPESHHSRSENRHSRCESSRSRSGIRSKSSMSGIEGDERSQIQEPRNNQYRELSFEGTAKQYQSRYQNDRHNTRRQGKYGFGLNRSSTSLLKDEESHRQFESELQRSELFQKNVGEWTIQDLANSEIERMVRMGYKESDQDFDFKEPSLIGNENFEEWRARWTTAVINNTTEMPEQQHMEHLNQEHTRQNIGSLHQEREMQVNPPQVENFNEGIRRANSRISPVMETAQTAGSVVPSTIQHKKATSETQTTHSSTRTSNDVIVETMISRWVGIDSQDPNSENRTRGENDVPEPNRNFHLDILHRRRRRQIDKHSIQGDHPSPTGDNTPPVKEYPLPAEKYINLLPPNQKMAQNQVLDLHTKATGINKTSQSSTTVVFEGISRNLTTPLFNSERDNHSTSIGSFKYDFACDYENINPSYADHQECVNSSDENIGNRKPLNQDSDNSYGNHNYGNVENVITTVDYENIVPRDANNTKCIENNDNIISDKKEQHNQKIRQKLIHDDSESSAAVAAALLAVHLAIIGDPEDVNGSIAVAGTGKLAAALCRADGRATVLPYRRHQTESGRKGISIGLNFDMCPLQVLGQPGPEGRRARLDVIERFACLQYLVEMTVIVTPCLLLIGDNSRCPVDTLEKENEWSLEDEYEYRRRLFYYQCAGISSWYFLGNNSSYNDEDGKRPSDLNTSSSCNSFPTKEEWAVEKRHWLDLLTRHRAAALDKWIRTAADAKQAVGDVYGYRALMTALCSDRIQTLQDAWATLRRVYTATAVTFESRLRPEFLGRRDHQITGMVSEAHNLNNCDDMDALLQLPPNATVPDPTALAVLYEHLYDEDSNPSIVTSNNIEVSTSMFTSPLLLSPSLWSTSNSGTSTISGGLGTSVAADYGLYSLHNLCVQYSKWVQSYNNDNSIHSSPMLQLERFRRNFQTLLRQYKDESSHDDDEDDFDDGSNQKDQFEKIESHREEFDYSRDDEFVYERNYEDKMEEFFTSSRDYECEDEDDDDDDDDATVICCSASTNSAAIKTIKEKRHRSWIKAAIAHGRGPAPLDIVFRTELHVRLFWPPTLLLDDSNNDFDQDTNKNHELVVPAYALGTTYAATAAVSLYSKNKEKQEGPYAEPALKLDQVINAQLNRAAQDMHFRYKIMDDFLDKACSYSTLASKMVNSAIKEKQQQHLS